MSGALNYGALCVVEAVLAALIAQLEGMDRSGELGLAAVLEDLCEAKRKLEAL